MVFFPITIPDRLSVDPDSPFYDKAFLDLEPIIKFNGVEQKNRVMEYCISEGWVKRHIPKGNSFALARNGKKLTFMSYGVVEVRA